jgi:hypothetical protein
MADLFPSLPTHVTEEIGLLIDLIMRDYIASWFCSVDSSAPYTDPITVIVAKKGKGEEGTTCTSSSSAAKDNTNDTTATTTTDLPTSSSSQQRLLLPHRTMLYSTNCMKASPFMDVMYDFLAFLFGNFGVTIMDRFNMLRFVMNKIVTVLAKTLKIYRLMRERAIRRMITHAQQHQ